MLYLKEYWLEGFKAGEQFIKQCPYSGNSLEARNWRNGWLEGATKALGLDGQPTSAQQPRGNQREAASSPPAATSAKHPEAS